MVEGLSLKRSVEHLEVCLQALSWRSQKRREWPSPSRFFDRVRCAHEGVILGEASLTFW
ncbi:hypothetical protein MNBD_GAMMA11-1433 [hydrothermal vent metagenome]|uniref:Uncharacterized protein n=1 Tax=hydrothermal vent metagenome TaxID=652676 RepID=A0A3B0X382_9ZZZZ